jgi:SSS family solute:Na+ symporter
MIIAALWAPAIDHFPGLFAYLQQAFAYVTPPLVAVFALGMLPTRLSADAALAGLLSGHGVSAVWFLATQLGWVNVHFTIVAFVLLVVTLAACALWQFLLGGTVTVEQRASVDASRVEPAPRLVRNGAVVLTVMTALLVVAFW